jgi:hypothetical protein
VGTQVGLWILAALCLKSLAEFFFGDRNVGSRIGAQWNSGKKSRLSELDDAVKAVPDRDRAATKMNAKLERCK